jgi:hypothetical protein
VNLTNHGLNTVRDFNYTVYILDPENPVSPQIVQGGIPILESGKSVSNPFYDMSSASGVFSVSEGKDYIVMVVVNASGDQYMGNNVVSKYLNARSSGVDLSIKRIIGVLPFISLDDMSVFEGENIRINFTVENKGDVDSGNVGVKIYEYSTSCVGDFEINDDPLCNLGLLYSFDVPNIQKYSTSDVSFDFISDEVGTHLLKIEVVSQNPDVYIDNNYAFAEVFVKSGEADIMVELRDGHNRNKEFFSGEINNLTVVVYNNGNEIARDVYVNLYYYNWSTGREHFLSERYLNEVLPGETIIDISFLIPEVGHAYFYVNASSPNDYRHSYSMYSWATYYIIDDSYSIRFYIDEIIRLGLKPTFNSIVGEEHVVYGSFSNIGKKINDIKVKIYADDGLVYSNDVGQFFHGDIRYFNFNWVPQSSGSYRFEFEGLVNGNEVLTETYHAYVYDSKQLRVNVLDSKGFPSRRYISSSQIVGTPANEYEMITGEYLTSGAKTFKIANTGDFNFQLIKYYNDDYVSAINNSIRYDIELRDIGSEINITSEYYEKIVDNNRNYYFVFANEIFSEKTTEDYGNYFMTVSSDLLKKMGIDNIKNKYAVFYCRDFSFANKKCNGDWNFLYDVYSEDADITVIFPFEWLKSASSEFSVPRLKLVTSYHHTNKVEAFALSASEGFDGSTTNFSRQFGTHINNFTLERSFFGKVRFLDSVDTTRLRGNEGLLESYIEISNRKIFINSDELYELRNKRAELTIKNVNMISPRVLYNGNDCPSSVCLATSYDKAKQTLVVNVTRFSSFTVVEGGSATPDAGDDSGLGGDVAGPACTPNWVCSWGPCINDTRREICLDVKRCGVNTNKPATKIEACVIGEVPEPNIIDISEDMNASSQGGEGSNTILILVVVLVGIVLVLSALGIIFWINSGGTKYKPYKAQNDLSTSNSQGDKSSLENKNDLGSSSEERKKGI